MTRGVLGHVRTDRTRPGLPLSHSHSQETAAGALPKEATQRKAYQTCQPSPLGAWVPPSALCCHMFRGFSPL